MSIFERAIDRMKENREREWNSIPFGFPRLENHLPGLMQKTYYLLTANSGVGKSQIADEMFVLAPYDFIKSNETDIKLKVFYNSLEMDKESKIIQWMARQIYKEYKIITEPNVLLSMGKNRINEELWNIAMQTRAYFEEMEDIVEILDEGENPYGIYKRVKQYCESEGKIYKKQIIRKVKNEFTGEITETPEEIFDFYKPNNPRKFVVNLTDHLAELTTEQGLDLKRTIEKHSDNNRILRNRFGVSPVDIQQQSASKEEQEFTFKGQSIESKLEPSLDGLGESKLTQRKANIVLGLFGPARFELSSYRGYDITKWKDNYRALTILKNRTGKSGVRTHLYFNGACNYWEELPLSEEFIKNRELYNKYGII